MIDSPPMANVEAECALLGGLMIENRLIDRVTDIVTAEDFAEPLCGRIFNTIVHEHALGRHVSPLTLLPYFVDDEAMKSLGGANRFLAQLTGSSAVIIGTPDFAHQIADLALRRRFSEQMLECAAQCENYERNIEELAGIAEGAIADALDTEGGAQSISAADAIEANINAQFDDAPGVTCGIIPSLDVALGAISPGDVAIIAGRPGMCKTALALSYAHGVAAQGHGVTFASLEMRAAQLGGRLACDFLFDAEGETPLPYEAVSESRCTPAQCRAMARAAVAIKQWPLWIEDLPAATTARLAAIVRRHKRRLAARGKVLRLVIVDYLQLLSPDRRGKNLYEETSMVSRALKSLAKAEGVGVLALCQLSREVERRADKRPTLSDLRDSGQIEQDADSIVFLLRREEYLRSDEPSPDSDDWAAWRRSLDSQAGKVEFIVAKRRAGRKSIGTGLWHAAYQAMRG